MGPQGAGEGLGMGLEAVAAGLPLVDCPERERLLDRDPSVEHPAVVLVVCLSCCVSSSFSTFWRVSTVALARY